jgi:hypothetical protein
MMAKSAMRPAFISFVNFTFL